MLLLCFTLQIEAQVNDNFSDGDFTSNPVWTGDIANWKITSFQLNSNLPTTATQSYLVTTSTLAQNAQWEFYIDLKFATSSLNYADVFLISDSANLQGVNSGIFVRIGNTADEISLYRKDGNLITKIIDGLDGRVGSTSSNIFMIKVTRSINNEFKLYDDASGTGNNYIEEGSITESAYQTSGYFGFLVRYSSANIQKFFFDNIVVCPIIKDSTPPLIDSVWAEDSFRCMIRFNEPMDSNSIFNSQSYSLNGLVVPVSVVRNTTGNFEIILTFSSPFVLNLNNNLLIKNVKDKSGNSLTDTSVTFVYWTLNNGALVINELYADPSPSNGLPSYEFIELWNVSGRDLNLLGFQLTDGNSTAIFPSTTLAKDSFLIISSTASLNAYSFFGKNIMLANFPTLNNDGDNIRLLNKQNQIIDEVKYDLSWYDNNMKKDGGWTLEMKNPKVRCRQQYNWAASNNITYGGTPGKINSAYDASLDTVAPEIISFELIDDSSAQIVFNTVMDSESVSQLTIVSNQNLKTKRVTNNNADSCLLTFEPLQNQFNYHFTFSNGSSCNGIKMRPAYYTFTFDKAFSVKFNGIVISELMVNPVISSSLPNSQYIELFNRSNYSVNLKGMKISDGISTAILPDFKLMKDSFIVIAPSSKANEFGVRAIRVLLVNNFPYLNSESDKISLQDSSGGLVNITSYETKSLNNAIKAKGGWSLEIIDNDNPCLMKNNWQFSIHPSGGTPGQENSVKGVVNDNTKLKFLRAYCTGEKEFVFVFNKAVNPEFSKNKISFEFNPIITTGYKLVIHNNNLNEISVLFPMPVIEKDSIYNVKIKNLFDCDGNGMDSLFIRTGYPSVPHYGDIAVNEILFNAKSYSSEFIEFYNTSDKIFDLQNLSLTHANKYGIWSDAIAAYDSPLQLLPGEYIVISTDANDIIHHYFSKYPNSIFTNTNWKTLDDDSGTIVISDINTSLSVDSVFYSKNWHHPFIANDDGVSLERVNFNSDGKERSNWLSASSNAGFATPAYQNSKFSLMVPQKEFVSLSKSYFTPNNDGMDDEITINIDLPYGNYSLNISVYDINGNEIHKIARNDIAGVHNTYIWDGRTTNGSIAFTGHYILLTEASDTNGNVKASKLIVDLLNR